MFYPIPNEFIGRQTRSALPDAPVLPDHPRQLARPSGTRLALSAALRALARRQLALASRLESAQRHPGSQPTPA